METVIAAVWNPYVQPANIHSNINQITFAIATAEKTGGKKRDFPPAEDHETPKISALFAKQVLDQQYNPHRAQIITDHAVSSTFYQSLR